MPGIYTAACGSLVLRVQIWKLFFSCGTFSRFPILFFVFWGIEYCYFRPSYSPFPRLEYLSRQFGSCGKRTYVEKVEIGAELLLLFPWSRHFSKAVFGKNVQFGLVTKWVCCSPQKKSFSISVEFGIQICTYENCTFKRDREVRTNKKMFTGACVMSRMTQ